MPNESNPEPNSVNITLRKLLDPISVFPHIFSAAANCLTRIPFQASTSPHTTKSHLSHGINHKHPHLTTTVHLLPIHKSQPFILSPQNPHLLVSLSSLSRESPHETKTVDGNAPPILLSISFSRSVYTVFIFVGPVWILGIRFPCNQIFLEFRFSRYLLWLCQRGKFSELAVVSAYRNT